MWRVQGKFQWRLGLSVMQKMWLRRIEVFSGNGDPNTTQGASTWSIRAPRVYETVSKVGLCLGTQNCVSPSSVMSHISSSSSRRLCLKIPLTPLHGWPYSILSCSRGLALLVYVLFLSPILSLYNTGCACHSGEKKKIEQGPMEVFQYNLYLCPEIGDRS